MEVNSLSTPPHEQIQPFPQHGGCRSLFPPVGCELTFEMSLLRQGEGWRSASSGALASVCKYRAWADGGKLAVPFEPYGAYAHGGVCKDPGARGASRGPAPAEAGTRHMALTLAVVWAKRTPGPLLSS